MMTPGGGLEARRRLRACLTLLAASWAVTAQQDPRFTWKGVVDGIIVLHIRGEQVEIEYRQGAPVEREAFHFYSALPDLAQKVRLEVLESRGSVAVTEQPRIDNNYTASVTIEDRQDGSWPYSIALYWDEAAPLSGRIDHLNWTGRVTGEVLVECRLSSCQSTVQSGDPVGRERFKFTRPLPDSDVRVTLDETGGRGDVRLMEQPSSQNGYKVKVRVRGLPGSGECSFVLSWPRVRARSR